MSSIAITCGEIHFEGQYSIVEKCVWLIDAMKVTWFIMFFFMDDARKLEEVIQTI